MPDMDFSEALDDALRRADENSPFLRSLIQQEAQLIELMHAQGGVQGFDTAYDQTITKLESSSDKPSIALRQARRGVALITALADLTGQHDLDQVTHKLSHFADVALDQAMTAAFAERGQRPAGLSVLALGKLGSHELNYSSDIDLIFLYDPERIARKDKEDPAQAAIQITRRIVALLSERTAQGYVFRVDLRLRPDPDSTPVALPVAAAIGYYQSQALAWERAAFIRARACAGDKALGEEFLREISSFVWRRSLDYSALAEVRDISRRIRNHYSTAQQPGPGFDLKRGRGGIREIEFFAQVYQLIFGGRDSSLRSGATIPALNALVDAGKIVRTEADALIAAYRFHRQLEHRIQMLNDQQTHQIPEAEDTRTQLARLCGEANWAAIDQPLRQHAETVGRLYDELLETGQQSESAHLPHAATDIQQWARQRDIADPRLLDNLVTSWRSGRARSLRASAAQSAFEIVMPQLVQEIGTGPAGRDALLRLNRLIESLPSGVQFWHLLAARPELQTTVARILGTAPLLADALARRPGLIDILLVPAPPLPDSAAAFQELSSAVRNLDDEALLNRVRIWTAERRFQLAVQLINTRIQPETAARELAHMAEATIALLAEQVMRDFSAQHGAVPGGRLVPLALGRFGGGELTMQSDLDLILLFTGHHEARSTGPTPLSASAWFNRVGQRLIAALSVSTAAGSLYNVDTRLRPSGENGLLVISLDSFRRYQSEQARLWEHMALTRARPVAALPRDAAAVQTVLQSILAMPREAKAVLPEVRALRRHMEKHKPAAGPFDLKQMRGGLVDIEFIVETKAILAGTPVPPGLIEAARQLAPELCGPARLMMDMLIMLRLVQPHDSTTIPDANSADLIARAVGAAGFDQLQQRLDAARQIVLTVWQQTFGTSDTPSSS